MPPRIILGIVFLELLHNFSSVGGMARASQVRMNMETAPLEMLSVIAPS